MLAINGGQPMMMSLREILLAFLDFREEVITRRTLYDLNKARERAHVLIGLAVAVVNIDEVIQVIRHAPDPATARTQLMDRSWPAKDVAPLIRLVNEPQSSLTEDGEYQMTEAQVKAILDLKLQRLTGLEREKVANELEDLTNEIQEYLEILGDRDKLISVMRDELAEVKEKFATPRRTSISEEEFERDIEDLIQREDMVVTVSHSGYIKRVPLKTYRAQRRGGKGRTGAKTKEEDFVSELFVANTHTAMLFFTDKGMAYELKVYKLPLGSPTSRGKPLINLLPLDKDEKVTVVTPLTDEDRDNDELDILFATSHGSVRRNTLDQFTSIRSNGLIAMKLEDDENLIAARICKESDDVILASRLGQAVRFNIGDNVRVFSGRYSTGVRGIRLAKGDEVISMSIVSSPALDPDERDQYLKMFRASENGSPQFNPDIIDDELALDAERFNQLAAEEEFLLSVATRGYGKRTSVYEYRQTNRGGKGVTNMKLTEKTGDLVGCFPVRDGNQLMMVTDGGQMIRIPVNGISIISRHTQGVRLFRVAKGEHIASVAKIVEEDDETGPDEAAAVDEIHAAPGSEVADPDTVEPDTTSTESE
jgi:DNA gyrase subunit A